MKTLIAPALAALILGACATSQTEQDTEINVAEDPRVGEEVDRLCFTRGISGFGKTTDRTVVLRRGSQRYLVTTRNRCRDLDDALSLGIDSFSGCLSRGDQIIGIDSVFGHNFNHAPSFPCFVDKIYEWDPDATDAPDTEDTDPTGETQAPDEEDSAAPPTEL